MSALIAAMFVITLALKGVSTYQKQKVAKKQAEATVEEGALKAKERAKRIKMLASQQKSSFASSGISLTGDEDSTTGVMLADTYDTGLEDIEQIKSNYNVQSSNIMSQARAQLLADLGEMAGMVFMATGFFGEKKTPTTLEGIDEGVGDYGIIGAMDEGYYKTIFPK